MGEGRGAGLVCGVVKGVGVENTILSDLRDVEYAIWDYTDNNIYIYRDVNM